MMVLIRISTVLIPVCFILSVCASSPYTILHFLEENPTFSREFKYESAALLNFKVLSTKLHKLHLSSSQCMDYRHIPSDPNEEFITAKDYLAKPNDHYRRLEENYQTWAMVRSHFARAYMATTEATMMFGIYRYQFRLEAKITRVYAKANQLLFPGDIMLTASPLMKDVPIIQCSQNAVFVSKVFVTKGSTDLKEKPIVRGMILRDPCKCGMFDMHKAPEYNWPIRSWGLLNQIFIANGKSLSKPLVSPEALKAVFHAYLSTGKMAVCHAFLANANIYTFDVPVESEGLFKQGSGIEASSFRANTLLSYVLPFELMDMNLLVVNVTASDTSLHMREVMGLFYLGHLPSPRILQLEPVFKSMHTEMAYWIALLANEDDGLGARFPLFNTVPVFMATHLFPYSFSDVVVALEHSIAKCDTILMIHPNETAVTAKENGIFGLRGNYCTIQGHR